MNYTTFAIGPYADENMLFSANQMVGKDFAVAHTGEYFTRNVQLAYDEHIPILAFVEHMLGSYQVNFGWDSSNWPINSDPLIKELDHYLKYSNGSMRAVHGIITDCSKTTDETGKPLTMGWITKHADFILKIIYKRYGLPVYPYLNQSVFANASYESQQSLISLMTKWGVCTVSPATVKNGYPAPEYVVKLPYEDPAIICWYFSLYGVANKPWQFIYNGSAEKLYNELAYKPNAAEEQADIPQKENPEPIVPIEEDELTINEEMMQKNNIIEKIIDFIRYILAYFGKKE